MGSAIDSDTWAVAETAIGWWRDAGVDVLVDDEPRRWLDDGAAPSARALVAAPPLMSTPVSVAVMPDTLPAFVEWFMTDTGSLASFPPRRRVAPEGNTASGVMIVTDVPEAGDVEAGRLLGGEAGQLLDRMLAAIGRDRASIYLATIGPARPATGSLDDALVDELAPVLMRHIALASPTKLWLLGRAASRAVLGMDEIAAGGRLHIINQEAATMDVIATVHPRILIREAASDRREKPFRKKTWETMQMLMEPVTQ